jgi:chromosome segregation ATPase
MGLFTHAQAVETHAAALAELRAQLAELDGQIESDEAQLAELDKRWRVARYERGLHLASGLADLAQSDDVLATTTRRQMEHLAEVLANNRRARPELAEQIKRAEQAERDAAMVAAVPGYAELLREVLAAAERFEAINEQAWQYRQRHFAGSGSEVAFPYRDARPNSQVWREFKRQLTIYIRDAKGR